MRRILHALVPGLVAVSLVACDSSSDAPPPVSVNLAEITSANAMTIASAVVNATFEGGDLGAFADLSGGLGGSLGPKPANVYSKLGEIQVDFMKPMLTDSQVGTFRATVAPTESPCEASGSTIVSGEIQNVDTLSVNDVITIEFVDCDDGVTVVDGTMSMTIRGFSGDFVGGSVSLEVAVNLDAFTVSEGGVSHMANGDITIAMDLPISGNLTMTISSQNLSMSDGISTESLASFTLSQTIDPITGAYTLTVSGQIDSSAFEGAVNFTTSVDLEGTGEAYAVTGQLVITGDANATITIIVLDGELIRLEVDLDGDGTPDEVIDTSWAELT